MSHLDPSASAPFTVGLPAGEPGPVLLSSPHSGRTVPPAIAALLAADAASLRPLDDGPVDRLIEACRDDGATVIAARYARIVVDLNRRPDEIDPELLDERAAATAKLRPTPRAQVGLGVVPSRAMGRPVWRQPLTRADLRARLAGCWQPYHAELERLLAARRRRWGAALLLDCHSMPALPGDGRPVEVALGDRFGRTCAPAILDAAEACLRAAGLRVARNRPFAGGYITERFGRPETGVSALQVELRRDLFMDEATYTPHGGFGHLQAVMRGVARACADAVPASAGPDGDEPLIAAS